MRPALPLLALMLVAAAPARAQQPAAPPVAPRETVKGLFGGAEPGDDEEAEGRTEPAPASPTAPPAAPSAEAYSARVRQSYAAAGAFRGRLDGAWTLSGRSGDLLRFQLTDKGDGRVEGAWRDLKRAGALDASGFVDQISLAGAHLDVDFKTSGGPDVRISLQAATDGRWSGRLTRGAEAVDVVLRRAP